MCTDFTEYDALQTQETCGTKHARRPVLNKLRDYSRLVLPHSTLRVRRAGCFAIWRCLQEMTDACQATAGIHNDSICYPSGIIWPQPVSAPFYDMAWDPTARESDLKLFWRRS
jgi:hypothetical protein